MSQSLANLSDGTLRAQLATLVAKDCATTAHLLAHLGEFDARRLYAEDGYSSTFVYCVQRLRFSEDMAFKRIRAARVARRFPFVLRAIAEGQVHLTAVVMLKPYLNPGNARELLEAATHKTKAEIEQLLARRFPQPDVRTFVRALPSTAASLSLPVQVVPEPVAPAARAAEGAPHPVEVVPEPGVAPVVSDISRLKPLAPQRFALQATIGQETHDKLRQIQDLLGHSVPPGDMAQVLDRAFDALLEKLQKAKCGATDKPRSSATKPSTNPRHVPASIRREVWKRDGGRCAFVSDDGQRCTARKLLEYDHVLEVARGGRASVEGVRLLCRTHNQFMAERAFGPEFMQAKREQRSVCIGAT